MASIPNAAQNVPMMFRAQINGRCQVQRLILNKDEQDAQRWSNEWVERVYPAAPEFGEGVQTRTYAISWRFITNSGQDDTVIRPVIGAKGWPFYPGSSMKGLFRQAAQQMAQDGDIAAGLCDRLCGVEANQDPGILRFHGAYPINTRWTQNLVDIVHPQQSWQVESSKRGGGALTQISLHKPNLKFGLSSTVSLSPEEWATIWTIWERGISMGIGSRVSAGYGQTNTLHGNLVYKGGVKGEGQAAHRLDKTGEFRPNMFKAAIRGHALRVFGGLTPARTAEQVVDGLFGGIGRNGATVGLLGFGFEQSHLKLYPFGQDPYEQDVYDVEGNLLWVLTRDLPNNPKNTLIRLIQALMRFSMLFGGFGKSWRRADHRLFYPDYYKRGSKPIIGCHWRWTSETHHLHNLSHEDFAETVAQFITDVRRKAVAWLSTQSLGTGTNGYASKWREVWHKDTVEVWGRIASDFTNSEAIHWFHKPYLRGNNRLPKEQCSIYQSTLTGGYFNNKMHIGRIWHRLYPLGKSGRFLELLIIFPDDSETTEFFLGYLDGQDSFQKIWPR